MVLGCQWRMHESKLLHSFKRAKPLIQGGGNEWTGGPDWRQTLNIKKTRRTENAETIGPPALRCRDSWGVRPSESAHNCDQFRATAHMHKSCKWNPKHAKQSWAEC